MTIHSYEILGKTKAFYTGPALEGGPLPTLFYFASYNRNVRFYIGNQYSRVDIKHTFSFIYKRVTEAHKNQIRSSPIEPLIAPSIGYQGHGTSSEIFKVSAEWIKGALLL